MNIVIVIFSAFISWFTLLFGLAHLIEGKNPNTPTSEHMMGVTICIVLCVIGVIFLMITLAAIKGILVKLKRKTNH